MHEIYIAQLWPQRVLAVLQATEGRVVELDGRMDRTRMAAFKLLHRHIIVWLVGAQYGELKLNEKV